MVSSTQNNNTTNSKQTCGKSSCSHSATKCGKRKFTQSFVAPKKRPIKKKTPYHPKGWHVNFHYMKIGGQCGQSCPCCRAHLFLTKIDPDAKWGACQICLTSN